MQEVPLSSPKPPPLPAPKRPTPRPMHEPPLPYVETTSAWEAWRPQLQKWPWALAVGGLLAWVGTLGSPPSLFVALHYGGLLVMPIGVAAAFAHRLPRSISRWSLLIGFGVGVLLCQVWVRFDTYVRREVEQREQDELVFRDTIARRNGRVVYRDLTCWKKEGGLSWATHGAMSETGKLHGMWTSVDYTTLKTTHDWYWYGEEITEGEWHRLR